MEHRSHLQPEQPELNMNLFEEAALTRAEADAREIRASARADAYRRLNAAETERREILTNASYRASVTLREAETFAAELRQEALIVREASVRNAMEERDRLRDDAMVQAQSIIENAASEAAKLLKTVNMEREHILADARDDARRIVEAAHETVGTTISSDREPAITAPEEATADPTTDATIAAAADEVVTRDPVDVQPIFFDDELHDLESRFDSTSFPRHSPSEPSQRRRRRWYHP
jgi:vacuolar-type H+-ATPase subunit H